jgi:hypothetical protein
VPLDLGAFASLGASELPTVRCQQSQTPKDRVGSIPSGLCGWPSGILDPILGLGFGLQAVFQKVDEHRGLFCWHFNDLGGVGKPGCVGKLKCIT